MPRNLLLSRDEAELLVELLEERDTKRHCDKRLDWLAEEIRQLFGMCSKEQEKENIEQHKRNLKEFDAKHSKEKERELNRGQTPNIRTR